VIKPLRTITWKEFSGILVVLFLLVLILLPLPSLIRNHNRSLCQNNLKQIGVVFKLYAEENKDYWPRLQGPDPWFTDGTSLNGLGADCNADDRNDWAPDVAVLFPDYIDSVDTFQCPGDSDSDLHLVDKSCEYAGMPSNLDASYMYLGYLIDRANYWISDDEKITPGDKGYGTTEIPTQLYEFLRAYNETVQQANDKSGYQRLEQFLASDAILPQGTGNARSDRILRLREGVERFVVTDINNPMVYPSSGTPAVMWDNPWIKFDTPGSPNHSGFGGMNVLFMDGHVGYLKPNDVADLPANSDLGNALLWAGQSP